MSHETLKVELGDRSYPIFIGENLYGQDCFLEGVLSQQQIFILTNETVGKLYLDAVLAWCRSVSQEADIVTCQIQDGEQHKTIETWSDILDNLMRAGFNRKATLIALGGGVVGDIGGFVAASYQRGIPFVQLPTTLLSQVDSSVGGKTGVNHALGKNMVGAFYQPQAVVIDTEVLKTLPPREVSAGLAEVIKYGLIYDRAFFEWLEAHIDQLIQLDAEALTYAIQRSCAIKSKVVAQDEYEGGIRAILNLGHTFGHAIETEMGYGTWLHGEAVGVGMVMACAFSHRLGWLEQQWVDRATELIRKAGLPVEPPKQMTKTQFLQHMAVDKKVLDGRLRLVLLKDCGTAVTTSEFDQSKLHAYLDELTSS